MSYSEIIKNWPRETSSLSKIRKSELTRQKILDAALDFLWTNSFRELTVRGLTKKAGVSRTSLYQYFDDLHSLMEELLNDLTKEIDAVVEPWFKAKTNAPLRLCESLHGIVTVCYHRGPILRAIVEAAPMDARLEKAWYEFLKTFDDMIAARIAQDQKGGLVLSFDPHTIAIALNRMDIGVYIHHFGRNPRSDIQPVYESIARIWLNTIYGKKIPVMIEG